MTLRRCSCDSILATSEACVPLVTCPEAAPLIGVLLQQPVKCVRAALSEDFLDALSSAYSRYSEGTYECGLPVRLWYVSKTFIDWVMTQQIIMFVSVSFFQPVLVFGGADSNLSVVSPPVQPGGGSAQSAGGCCHQQRVDTTETTGATGTVTAGG